MRWARLIEEEWNFKSKLDHYLAQIAFLLDLIPARIWGDKKYRSDLDDFFIRFKTGTEELESKPEVRKFRRRLPSRRKRKNKFAGVSPADLARYGTKFDPKDMTPDEKRECDSLKASYFADLLLDPEGKPRPEQREDMLRKKAMGLHKPAEKGKPGRNNPLVRKDVKDGH